STFDRDLRMLVPFRGCLFVRGSAFIRLAGPRAYCNNMVQARGPGIPIIRHQVPQSSVFIARSIVACEHFATLVVFLAPFHKYPEPFLCLVGISRYYTIDEDAYPEFLGDNDEGMNLLAFIRTADPTKVKVAERQQDEPRLLESTVGRVVPLLPIALARASSELEASVDKLFDEGASGDGGYVDVRLVAVTTDTIVEDVAPLQPRRQRKRKTAVADASGPSYPPKKLREDYRALGGASTGGKSMSTVQSLFTGAVLDAEARGEPIPTLPFVTSSVSATPERKDKSPADSVPGLNLQTIGAPQRFVISLDSSHNSGANIAKAEVDSIVRSSTPAIATVTTVTAAIDTDATTTRAPVAPSLFGHGSSSTGRTDSVPGGFFDVPGSNFLIGGICTVVDPDSDLQKVYTNLPPPKFFASVRGMDHDQLFIEFNVRAARQISLYAEVRMRAEYNIREKRKLIAVVDEQGELLKAKDGEIESLKPQLLLKDAKATEAMRLQADVFKFESAEQSLRSKVRKQEVADLDAQVTTVKLQNDSLVGQGFKKKITAYEGFVSQLEKFQDEKLKEVNEKFDKLSADFVEMALHLEEKFYPHLLTTIFGRRWLLTYGIGLVVAKCLNSTEYFSALGAVISRAIENGMQEGLSAGITHGTEGRQLADVAAYNPSAEADYLSALQHLQNVNFSLIAELKSNKDASVDTIMNLLRLDDVLTERIGLTKSQPHVNQLMVPIHHSSDQRVVGASALPLSLEVSHSRVKKMRENIANYVSPLCGVFVPFSERPSAAALEGMEGTFGSTHDAAATLSITFVSTSTILPISTDDYEVAHADGQGGASVGDETTAVDDMNLFVSNVKLNISE
nr:putative transposase (putative), gypsy type [Tanacetum cinerariifolium]